MEIGKAVNNQNVMDIETDNSEDDGDLDKVMHYTFEQISKIYGKFNWKMADKFIMKMKKKMDKGLYTAPPLARLIIYIASSVGETLTNIRIFQVLVLRKTLHDVVTEENLEIPTPFRQDVITDAKGFFVIFGIVVIVCILAVSYSSLQTQNINVDRKFDEARKNISDFQEGFWYDLRTLYCKFILNVVITIVLCVMVLCLILFFPTAVLRTAVFCVVTFFAVLIPISWALVVHMMGTNIIAIICTIVFTIPSFFVIIFAARYCSSYIHLTGSLYKEAEKVILAMPGLLFLTHVSILLQLIILAFFITAAIPMITSDNGWLLFSNIVATNWGLYFVEGFHCMATAGSVASWYNSGCDQPLNSPILKSLVRVVKYHIGTVAVGTSLHPFVTFVQKSAKVLSCNFFDNVIFNGASFNPEFRMTPFLKKYTYVTAAIYGKPYVESGRQAVTSFLKSAPIFITLKERADLASLAVKLNLLLYSTGISCLLFWGSDNMWLPIIQCLFTNMIIITAFFETLETTAHTLLTNLCEDELLRQYFHVAFTKEATIMRIK